MRHCEHDCTITILLVNFVQNGNYLTKQFIDIFAAPDTATAWDHIFRKLPEVNEGPGNG
jgi:hypothetical protein